MRGYFITLEGGKGAGKSTHAMLLANKLRRLGVGVVLTREPGGSPGAEIIRHVLRSGAAKPLGPDAEALLSAAARDDHVRNTIEPALARGRWVICECFIDSTRVYQGAVGQVNPLLIKGLERVTVGALRPDLTFILDVPVEIALGRRIKRRGDGKPDRLDEEETPEFHAKVRDAFAHLAFSEPDRCVLIDASDNSQNVADRIWKVVSSRLDPATAPVAVGDTAS
jgi:dTMP kinase